MRDIVEPDPIPWWPPAPGGILILYLLLGAVAYGLYRWHLYRAENRYRRLALRELSELCMSIPDTTSVSALSALLKRTALMGYPRSEVASLSGSSWRSFLEKTSAPFRDASESKLFFSLDAYDPKHLLSLTDEDWAGACQAVGIWIRTHRWLSATAEEERAGA